MHVRFLEYFVALAREQHFARAAAICHVTQPTLSAGIVALEEMLGGAKLVERDRRFVGLTREGEAALPWAQAMLADNVSLREAVAGRTGPLSGALPIGVIPAAIPISGRVVRAVTAAHPGVTVVLRSMTSREIASGLAAHELEAGLTYVSHEPPVGLRAATLHRERFMFVTRADAPLGARATVEWSEVAATPLCLLHEGMQNRRILDAHLTGLGIALRRPVAIADSYVALLAIVDAGGLSTVVTDSYRPFLPADGALRMIPFAQPAPPNEIALVVLDRPHLSPLAQAALAVGQALAVALR